MDNKQNKTFQRIRYMFQRMPQLGALVILIVAFIFFGILSPVNSSGISAFLTFRNIGNLIEATSSISLCAFGMTLILLVGGIDLSVGSVIGVSSMIGCKLMANSEWPILPAVLIVLLVGIAAGALNGALIVRFDIQPFLVTMSTMTMLRGVVYAICRGESYNVPYQAVKDIFCRGKVFGLPVTLFWTVGAMLIMWIVASKTKFGRNCQGIGGNEMAARNSGINVPLVKIGAYTIAGLLYSVAGMITLARLGSVNAVAGQGAEMNAIASSILGGTSFSGDGGNMIGTLLGSLVMGVLVNGLTILGVDSYYQDIIKGAIIIIAVIGSNYLISGKQK